MKAAGRKQAYGQLLVRAIAPKNHSAQRGLLPQVKGRLGARKRPELDGMSRTLCQRRQWPAASDEYPRGGADELLGQQRQAVVPSLVLTSRESRRWVRRFEIGLEIIEHDQDRLVPERAEQVAGEPLQSLRTGELGGGIAVNGIGGNFLMCL